MSDYTADEIEQAVTGLAEDPKWEEEVGDNPWDSFGYGDGLNFGLTLRGEKVIPEMVARHGGEGQGDEIWVVLRIGDQLFKKEGYYASHYGSDWDGDLTEVHEVQRLVTFYE